MKALGYIRCSTEEQADSALGLEAQEAAIRSEAARRGWDVEIVTDAGYSAKNLKRPGITQALETLDNSKSSALIVARLDRLSRSIGDFSAIVERSQRKGWQIVCMDADIDTSTPSGELMANVLVSFSQFERKLIGQRTSEALQAKKARGEKLGRPRSVCDEAVEYISIGREQGISYRRLADGLNQTTIPTAQGGRWHPETVRQIDKRDSCPTPASTVGTTPTTTNVPKASQ